MIETTDASIEFAPHLRSARVDPEGDAMLQQAYRLRYDVYCLERSFLDAADYPQRLESDCHDITSGHFCALNLRDELVGYVRMVRPGLDGSLPFIEHGATVYDMNALPAPAHAAEISRLMVRSDYRRRRGDVLAGITVAPTDAQSADERRSESPQILLSLFRQMYGYSLIENIHYWYAAMERPLARALMRMGFAFRQIGSETDYYGNVAPYIADLRELEQSLASRDPSLWYWMRQHEKMAA